MIEAESIVMTYKANIFAHVNDNLKLLQWDESSQQLETGGFKTDRPESIFKVERTHKKGASTSSLKICLEVDPEEKLGVDMKTKKIIATSTDIPNSCVITLFYDTPIGNSSYVKIHVGGVNAKDVWAIPKEVNSHVVGVVNEDTDELYNCWFQIEKINT